MSLPTPDNLKTMDYAYQAQPFVYVPAKDTIEVQTMDYAYQAQPFVANETSSGGETYILKYFNGVAWVGGILKRYNGESWVIVDTIKYYNGASWITLEG